MHNPNSRYKTIFHGFSTPEKNTNPAGYAALIETYSLSVPMPDYLCAIGIRHKRYKAGRWQIFTPRHKPDENLYGHLVFALKYEGIDLAILDALFTATEPKNIEVIVRSKPTGAYSRRIWFLWEWLRQEKLDIEDTNKGNFIPLINDTLQYPGNSSNSRRHRVRNNLPGTHGFCPLIRKTEKLERFINLNLSLKVINQMGKVHTDLLSRAAAFLLLKDSKASHIIEGENPPHNRIERWGKIIGEAGRRQLNIKELQSLQTAVITDNRFVKLGWRTEGGFVGEHDRTSGTPIPDHISARPEDLNNLLTSLMENYQLLCKSDFDAVLTATVIAFGFVFIHPFEDGNGRIHRYLIHHVLAEKGFTTKEVVFPISAVILKHIEGYRKTLEHYSKPRLELIKWRPTPQNNIEVLNKTINLYRYFDATRQAEFLFECIEETVTKTLPEEIEYLKKYDLLNNSIKNYIDMPDRLVDLLIRFLRQNSGQLSKRAREKEFKLLSDTEVREIEHRYDDIFSE